MSNGDSMGSGDFYIGNQEFALGNGDGGNGKSGDSIWCKWEGYTTQELYNKNTGAISSHIKRQ